MKKYTKVIIILVSILCLASILYIYSQKPKLILSLNSLDYEKNEMMNKQELLKLIDNSSEYETIQLYLDGKELEETFPITADVEIRFVAKRLFFQEEQSLLIKAKDTKAPRITLKYKEEILKDLKLTLEEGETFIEDIKAEAFDYAYGKYDQSLPVTIPKDFKNDLEPGDYTFIFSAIDKAKNKTEIKLTVIIEEKIEEPETVVTYPPQETSHNSQSSINNHSLVNKTHPISKDYVPVLKDIPSGYAVSSGYVATPETVDAFVALADALYNEKGLGVLVTSSYRSYSFQGELYESYVAQYGEQEANRFSAKPGTSEHQTGLALDLVSPGGSMWAFRETEQYQWIKDNAHRFGFIIRYPEGKESITGYMPEAWHLRYLDISTATKVYQSGLTYEEYLGILD